MFTAYIDDSGTDPNQQVVIASALIVSAERICSLDQAWKRFDDGYKFGRDFHSSECAARNPRSVFAGWSERKCRNAMRRARSIIKDHSIKAFTFTIHKEDFTNVMPQEWMRVGGKFPFTWACRVLLHLLRNWCVANRQTEPFEYIIDWMDSDPRKEVETVFSEFEIVHPGEYEGRYAFKKRQTIPGLQGSDLLAWSGFSRSRYAYRNTPMARLAESSSHDFERHLGGAWWNALAFDLASLKKAVAMDTARGADHEVMDRWLKAYMATQERRSSRERKPPSGV